ncbi:speckle-type POZ protein-like B [Musca autumnalis]|uniref:speckle-type POZ protein-like B n=1 Tax=Musca autumnalis TaxID=221902 RepID=UPI003CFB9D76
MSGFISNLSNNANLWCTQTRVGSGNTESPLFKVTNGNTTSIWKMRIDWDAFKLSVMFVSASNDAEDKSFEVTTFCTGKETTITISTKQAKNYIIIGETSDCPCDYMHIFIKINVVCEPTNHRLLSNVTNDLAKALASENFSDIILVAKGGTEYKAHKVILSARSDVFDAMFRNECLESKTNRIEIDDMEADVMREMLNYIYTGKVVHEEMAPDLLMVANNC